MTDTDPAYQAALDTSGRIVEREAARRSKAIGPITDDGGLAEKIIAATMPEPLDLAALAKVEPQPPRFIVDDWLPVGYATLLAGHGGVGKSGIALHLAACVSLGRVFCGLQTEKRRVLYLSCEDRTGVLHWRLRRIADHLGINLSDLHQHLDVLDLVGHDAVLWEKDPTTGMTRTLAYHSLRDRIEDLGTDFLIVDGVSDTFGGNENARNEVKRYVNALVALIPEDRGSVLLVGHVAKPAASSSATSEGYSGSTGWHNSVRARWYLYPEQRKDDDGGTERTGSLILDLQKSNHGRTDQSLRFTWDAQAHLYLGSEVAGRSRFEENLRGQEEQESILAALMGLAAAGAYCPAAAQGPRTAHHVLSACPELSETLRGKANRRRFWRHIEHLRQIRSIVESTYRRSNRHLIATLEAVSPDKPEQCADAPYHDNEISTQSDARRPCADAPHSAGGYRGSARAQPSTPADLI